MTGERQMAVKFTRKQRAAAREEAQRRLHEVKAREVRTNDEIGSHITVFVDGDRRIEWWPGARRWREDDNDFFGDVGDFIARFEELA